MTTANEITAKKAKANIKSLLAKANKETGKEHTNLTDAFEDLALGYGVEQTEVFDGNIELEGEFEPGEPEITDYYQDGYDKGYSKGLKDGGGEGIFEEGKKAAYEEIQGLNAELEQTLYGTDTGGKSYYDLSWDNIQNYGERETYAYAFGFQGWNDTNFKPKYDIRPIGECSRLFSATRITDLEAALERAGVVLDTSQATSLNNAFSSEKGLTVLPVIDISKCTSSTAANINIQPPTITIRKLIFSEKTRYSLMGQFRYAINLENLTIGGVIGYDINLQWSKKLTLESLVSALTHLFNFNGSGEEWSRKIILAVESWNLLKAQGAVATNPVTGEACTWIEYVEACGWLRE